MSVEGPYGERRLFTIKAGRYRLACLFATDDRPFYSETDAPRPGASGDHDEDPYWMGTSITWVLAQVLDIEPRDQTVATVAPATRAAVGAPAPNATVVVPGGGEGNSRHPLVEPSATNNRSAPDAVLSRTKRPLPSAGPKDVICSSGLSGKEGEVLHRPRLPDQAATRFRPIATADGKEGRGARLCGSQSEDLHPTTFKRTGKGGADEAPSPGAPTEEPDNPRTAAAPPYEGLASEVTDCAERPEPAGPARSSRLAKSVLAHDRPPIGKVAGAGQHLGDVTIIYQGQGVAGGIRGQGIRPRRKPVGNKPVRPRASCVRSCDQGRVCEAC